MATTASGGAGYDTLYGDDGNDKITGGTGERLHLRR
jgi:Ca2+-binding RTX toxin-like protein